MEHFKELKELLTETPIIETKLVKETQNENNPSTDDDEIEKPKKEEVLRIITSGNNGKAPGNDGINHELIK
ncbi:hypothetical protein QE152_g26938 [Popillia japonica]|uniref:Uncharacterized protein n=1 Tax=Popillia japonica TaxID=7064 RepID=A0AAW1JV78_POPJA